MSGENGSKHWWQTAPAILGGLATLIGAITGLLIALNKVGIFNSEPQVTVQPTPAVTEQDSQHKPQVAVTVTHTEPNQDSNKKADPATGFKVVEAFLRADPFNYVGPCPVKIVFTGRISAVDGSGTVSYKFLRNDGALGPVKSIHFDGPGSKNITETWMLGAASPRFQPYSGWEAIKIFDPKEAESKKATFKIHCK